MTAQHIGHEADEQTELVPVDWKPFELCQALPSGESLDKPVVRHIAPGCADPTLHATLRIEQIDLHERRIGQFRLALGQRTQLGDFAGFRTCGAG